MSHQFVRFGRVRRRTFLSALVVAAAGLSLSACGQDTPKAEEGKAEVPVEELMKSGSDLPELTMGPADAKVTVVEYASMTCGHCMRFHTEVLPELKKKYIDTGKVRYVFREFPLDPRAFGGSMLARCLGGDKALALIDTLFRQQEQWAHVKTNPKQALFEVVKQASFTEESFEKCLTDQKLFEQLSAVQKRAGDVFGVTATPSLFVNGRKLKAPSMEELEKAIEPLLAEG